MSKSNTRRRKSQPVYKRRSDPMAPVRVKWYLLGTKIMVVVIGATLASVLWALTAKEYDLLSDRREELRAVEADEREVLEELQMHTTQRQALLRDRVVLEAYARDRLDYAKPGEKIIRIERER